MYAQQGGSGMRFVLAFNHEFVSTMHFFHQFLQPLRLIITAAACTDV